VGFFVNLHFVVKVSKTNLKLGISYTSKLCILDLMSIRADDFLLQHRKEK